MAARLVAAGRALAPVVYHDGTPGDGEALRSQMKRGLRE